MDEVMILRSRVEEQAELVMLMKSRNDEASKEIQRLRDTVKQLEEREAERGAREQQLKAENEKLKANFATLSKNHEEIIKLKDEYKGENANLRKKAKETDEKAASLDAHIARERDRITGEYSERLRKAEEEGVTLLSKVQTLEATVKKSDAACKGLQASLDQSTGRLQKELAESKASAAALQKERDDLQDKWKKSSAENEDLKKTAMLRQKETEGLSAQVEQLKQKLDAAERAARTAEERMRESSADQQVAGFRQQMETMQQEYDAFKKHSAQLLKQEKDLNAKLRRLAEG